MMPCHYLHISTNDDGESLIYDDIMTMLDIIVPKSLGMNFHKIAH